MEIAIRNDRIKRIDITDGNAVLGQAVFNPYDIGIYKKYTDVRIRLAKDKQEYEALVKERNALIKDATEDGDEDELFETGEYEKLDTLFQSERKLGDGIDNIFANLKSGVDGIFGDGVFDLITQGYQDEGMLEPLFEAAKPFFDEAAKERGEKVEQAKLNREQRRAKK